MSTLFQDLKYTLRTFSRSPGFAVVAVLTLALGIGANTAIFSVVDSALLRPIPYPDSGQLVFVEHVRNGNDSGAFSFPDFRDFRDQVKALAQMVAYRDDSVVLTGRGSPKRLDGVATTANVFDTIGVAPAWGRGFAAGEDVPGKNRVIVLSHDAWSKHFGADPEVIGKTATIDQVPTTIIGVMPAGFRLVGSATVDYFMPLPRAFDQPMMEARGAHWLQSYGRLAPGATVAQASAQLDGVAQRLGTAFPRTDANRRAFCSPLQEHLAKNIRPALIFLLAAVALVLLIACANVANLLLARATVRQRELAIRFALGASRGRVIRQMLTESVVLALVGGVLGVGLALWGLDALRSILPEDLTQLTSIAVDGRVLLFTLGISVATGVVFGILPAIHGAAGSPADALKEGARTTGGARQRARSVLVAVEVAFAMLLLVGAGLTLKSFGRLLDVDPGFNPRNVIVASVTLPDARYDSDEKRLRFYRKLKDGVAGIPGVSATAMGYPLPYSGGNMSFRWFEEGTPPPEPGHELVANFGAVNAEFARALELPVVRGRFLTEVDDDPKAPMVAVVNETFVRKFFPDADVIGKHIVVRDKKAEIVGIVRDARVFELASDPLPQIYAPFSHNVMSFMAMGARTGSPAGFAAALQHVLEGIDADQPLDEIKPMTEYVAKSIGQQRLQTLLVGVFGAVALVLALVGVYGVMSYTVTQRVREIGVRMALGARPGDVTRMVVRQGLRLAVIGVGSGLVAALFAGRLAASLFYGVSASDPATLAATASLLLGVTALATWFPARRAARVDPMIALRAE